MLTHDELIIIAAHWLYTKKRCALVLMEPTCIYNHEQPDVLALKDMAVFTLAADLIAAQLALCPMPVLSPAGGGGPGTRGPAGDQQRLPLSQQLPAQRGGKFKEASLLL